MDCVPGNFRARPRAGLRIPCTPDQICPACTPPRQKSGGFSDTEFRSLKRKKWQTPGTIESKMVKNENQKSQRFWLPPLPPAEGLKILKYPKKTFARNFDCHCGIQKPARFWSGGKRGGRPKSLKLETMRSFAPPPILTQNSGAY